MELLEWVFGYLDEGLSIKEACIAAENDIISEQKEILEQTMLRYPGYKGDILDAVYEELGR